MNNEDLVKIAKLALYAEWCSIILFEQGFEGKSQSLKSKSDDALNICGVQEAYRNHIQEGRG